MKCVSNGSHSKVVSGSRKGWFAKITTVTAMVAFFAMWIPQAEAAPGQIIPAGPPDFYNTAPGSGEPVTQLDFIKWLVNLTGDTPLFDELSTVGDYVFWAHRYKIKPKGGWNPDEALTQDFFAKALVDFYRIKSKLDKEIETLAREGIFIPNMDLITWAGLIDVVDDAGFQSRLSIFSHLLCSPIEGKNNPKHKITIDKCTPPPPPVDTAVKRKFRKFKEKNDNQGKGR